MNKHYLKKVFYCQTYLGRAALKKDMQAFLLQDLSKPILWGGLKVFNTSQQNLVAESSSWGAGADIKGLVSVVMPENVDVVGKVWLGNPEFEF